MSHFHILTYPERLDDINEDVLSLSETTRVDPGKTATSALRSATSPRKVLASVVVAERNYGGIANRFLRTTSQLQ